MQVQDHDRPESQFFFYSTWWLIEGNTNYKTRRIININIKRMGGWHVRGSRQVDECFGLNPGSEWYVKNTNGE